MYTGVQKASIQMYQRALNVFSVQVGMNVRIQQVVQQNVYKELTHFLGKRAVFSALLVLAVYQWMPCPLPVLKDGILQKV